MIDSSRPASIISSIIIEPISAIDTLRYMIGCYITGYIMDIVLAIGQGPRSCIVQDIIIMVTYITVITTLGTAYMVAIIQLVDSSLG